MHILKIFVLDTNVLLQDPYSIFKFGANKVIIPAIVLEEVDGKKRLMDEVGRNARTVSRLVDDMIKRFPRQLSKGVSLDNGGILTIEMNHISYEKMKDIFSEKTNDNRILSVAKNLQEENPSDTVVVVSMDILVRVKADALDLEAQTYQSDKLVDNSENVHKGCHEIFVTPELINKFYEKGELDFAEIENFLSEEEVCPQDFFIMKDINGSKSSALARFVLQANRKKLIKMQFDADSPEGVWGIHPKNSRQRMLIELLMDSSVPLVCAVGKAGTGKTLIALAAALTQTENDKKSQNIYKKILAARPVIPMGKDIGYLPGDMKEKLRPWMQPIYDNLEYLYDVDSSQDNANQDIENIVAGLKLQVEALTYIRGRSIPQQFIIIDEAQNLSKHEVKTILTRSGEGTKIVLLGDPDQIDQPYLDATNNGLTYVIEKMKEEPEVGIIQLEKTERSSLAEKAARLL